MQQRHRPAVTMDALPQERSGVGVLHACRQVDAGRARAGRHHCG